MRAQSKPVLLALLLLLMLVAGGTVLAQSSASFDLRWHVIGGGGGEASSASYRLQGTTGQSLASPPTSGSARFAVSSGYWPAATGTTLIYLPAIQRN